MALGKRRRVGDGGVIEKQCPVCERWFPLADWPMTTTGLHKDTCSPECRRIKANRNYHADPSKQAAASRRWIAKNRERVNAQAREWHRRKRAATGDARRAAAAERRRQRRQDRLDRIAREGKVCPHCGERKPADLFGWNTASRDYASYCKACHSNLTYATYRKNHPAKYPGTKGRPVLDIPIPVGETYVTKNGGEREIMATDPDTITVKVINRFGETIGTERRQRHVVRQLIRRGDWVPGGEQYYRDPDMPGYGIRVLSLSDETARYRVTTPTQPTGSGPIYHIRRAEFDRLVKIEHWVPA